MKTKISIVFSFLFFSTQLIFSQINGKIIDKDINAPLEYATAALYKINTELVTGVVTNTEGEFH